MTSWNYQVLGTGRQDEQRKGPEDNVELSLICDKISTLDKSVVHMSDMRGAIKGQSDEEHIIVEMGGDIFKGEEDVQAWIEENLPCNHLFGVTHKYSGHLNGAKPEARH
eukprot:3885168-Ditylum_brightwellii.AAC.1